MKSFALGLALKQRRNATRKSPISFNPTLVTLITITTCTFAGILYPQPSPVLCERWALRVVFNQTPVTLTLQIFTVEGKTK